MKRTALTAAVAAVALAGCGSNAAPKTDPKATSAVIL
jgi:hypothetical protein